MTRLKVLMGLTLGVALIAVSAAPAGAWFKSRNQAKTQGLVSITGTTTLETGAAVVSCATASGEWKIQTKGEWQEHEVKKPNPEESKQVKTTFGPHLNIKIYQWNTCKSKVTGVEAKATKVSECSFQLEQPQKGVNTATATVIAPCVITATVGTSICEITVTPGNKEGVNEGLEKVTGVNSGQNLLATAAVELIHGKTSGTGCSGEEFKAGKFKSPTEGLVGEGLELA
jgi:hypothetical protein